MTLEVMNILYSLHPSVSFKNKKKFYYLNLFISNQACPTSSLFTGSSSEECHAILRLA